MQITGLKLKHLKHLPESRGRFVKTQLARPHHQKRPSEGLRWGPRTGISDKFPGAAAAAQRTTLHTQRTTNTDESVRQSDKDFHTRLCSRNIAMERNGPKGQKHWFYKAASHQNENILSDRHAGGCTATTPNLRSFLPT